MKLKKLSLKNIRSYKEEEIIFPEGSILLAGDIGSGKTSILLALEYSLFGLQPGQRGASLLRNGTAGGEVSLEFEIDGKKVIIERKLKRSHKSVTNEYASIKIDNERIEASLTEIKIKILELMGYPQEFIKKNNLLYRYTVYTPQEHMKQIILEDPEVRLNVLRHILGIDKYKRVRENLTVFINKLKEESKILQGEIKSLDDEKAKLQVKKSAIKVLEEEIIIKVKELEEKTFLRKNLELDASNLEIMLKEKIYLEKEVEKTKIMISNKYDNISTIEQETKEIEKSISEIGELFNEEEYQAIIKSLENKIQRIDSISSNYAHLAGEINSLEKQKQETLAKRERVLKIQMCPTCLQDVSETHKHNILNETENIIGKAKSRVIALESELVIISKEMDKLKIEKKYLENQKTAKELLKSKTEYLERAKKRKEMLSKSSENILKDISLLEKHLQVLKEKIFELSKYNNLLKLKKEDLVLALQEERKADISLAEIKKEIELLKKDIVSREESITAKELIKKNLAYISELHDWLSVSFLELIQFIERNVLLKLRQEFSRVFSKWFHMLVPAGSLNVRLDESFSPIILHKDIEMEYSFLSGGERTAVALAYRLALNQIINSMLSKIKTKDLVILDEPTDGFSEPQLEKMREVLNELNVSQLVIVSHERKIESFMDNILRIRKIGDISSLEPNNTLETFLQEAKP
ncbi:MAG: AAA family ATPase [Nanoarchaeota archaeon]|nr:AAA family ATPase [Nanoarchaeota archaeon]